MKCFYYTCAVILLAVDLSIPALAAILAVMYSLMLNPEQGSVFVGCLLMILIVAAI